MQLDEYLSGTDALTTLDAAHEAAWASTDQQLLGLCRDRVAMLLGHQPTLDAMSPTDRDRFASWPSDRFDDRERAALDFTEQYVIDVASVTDAQVDALRSHLGDDGLVDFVNALLVLEQRMSLELIFDGVLVPTAGDDT